MRQVVALVLQVADPLVLLPAALGKGLDEIRELPRPDGDAVGGQFEEVVEQPFARDHLEEPLSARVPSRGRRCPRARPDQSTNL